MAEELTKVEIIDWNNVYWLMGVWLLLRVHTLHIWQKKWRKIKIPNSELFPVSCHCDDNWNNRKYWILIIEYVAVFEGTYLWQWVGTVTWLPWWWLCSGPHPPAWRPWWSWNASFPRRGTWSSRHRCLRHSSATWPPCRDGWSRTPAWWSASRPPRRPSAAQCTQWGFLQCRGDTH